MICDLCQTLSCLPLAPNLLLIVLIVVAVVLHCFRIHEFVSMEINAEKNTNFKYNIIIVNTENGTDVTAQKRDV